MIVHVGFVGGGGEVMVAEDDEWVKRDKSKSAKPFLRMVDPGLWIRSAILPVMFGYDAHGIMMYMVYMDAEVLRY